MITNERQTELFNGILDSLNSIGSRKIHLLKPILDLNCLDYEKQDSVSEKEEANQDAQWLIANCEHCPHEYYDRNIFDFLGYFKKSAPDRVFLCEERIDKTVEWWIKRIKEKYTDRLLFIPDDTDLIFSNVKEIKEKLTEIIYIHECAHYLHFHINEEDYIKWPPKDRKMYVETFAQLLTDRMVKVAGPMELMHSQIFEHLKKGQEEEYNIYSSDNYLLNTYPDFIIYETFLCPNTINAQNSDILGLLGVNLKKEYGEHLEKLKEDPENTKIIVLIEDLEDIGLGSDFKEKIKTLIKSAKAWSSLVFIGNTKY
jgi:hypothetical protein